MAIHTGKFIAVASAFVDFFSALNSQAPRVLRDLEDKNIFRLPE